MQLYTGLPVDSGFSNNAAGKYCRAYFSRQTGIYSGSGDQNPNLTPSWTLRPGPEDVNKPKSCALTFVLRLAKFARLNALNRSA